MSALDPVVRDWRSVVGYEHLYEESDDGEVTSVATGRTLRPQRHKDGYLAVHLYSGRGVREPRYHYIHRLVAAAFLGPCPIRGEVNHRDGDKTNNWIGNLEYVTRSENGHHAYRTGLQQPQRQDGEHNSHAKLTANDVAEIRRRYKPWKYTAVRLAREFGISEDHVRHIIAGANWKAEATK